MWKAMTDQLVKHPTPPPDNLLAHHALDHRVVDELVYLKADGTPHRFVRGVAGRVSGSPFQGRASLRELANGYESLDAIQSADWRAPRCVSRKAVVPAPWRRCP